MHSIFREQFPFFKAAAAFFVLPFYMDDHHIIMDEYYSS